MLGCMDDYQFVGLQRILVIVLLLTWNSFVPIQYGLYRRQKYVQVGVLNDQKYGRSGFTIILEIMRGQVCN